jgi:ketosteroid isomerase-like protein
MSEDNVEVVKRMYAAFYAGDFETALGQFDPNVLVDPVARPDLGVGKGREFVRDTVASWMAVFDDWSDEIGEIRDLGGRVLVLSSQRGRGKGSGVEVESQYALLYDLHGGAITSMRMYASAAEALAAAG